jgi:signal peptidase
MTEPRGPNPPATEEPPTWRLYLADIVESIGAVALVGLLLFAVSGVWPPLVAIESHSMTPHIGVGDLVFVMESDRFAGPNAESDTGVVTAAAAADTDYTKFANPGDVIVYAPDGNRGITPIIHRAMFHVEKGEKWADRADPDYLNGPADCDQLSNCPAPHDGFITKGDANGQYDQVGPSELSGPVKSQWVIGTAEANIPWLGCIRLSASGADNRPDACAI